MRLLQVGVAAALLTIVTQTADSQPIPAPPLAYADLADLALSAPVAAHVEVKRARALRGDNVIGVPAGHTRFLIEAEVLALIRAGTGLPRRVSYLIDLPNGTSGRAPRIRRGTEYLIFASVNPGEPDELRLAAPDAQIAFTPDNDRRVRDILTGAARSDAPPRITGVGQAFHVRGSLPGESETQIFLQTADNRPISLSVLRRPGEQPRWAVALGEIVDASAASPEPETLLWYRLACFLPRNLPPPAMRSADRVEARAVEADYRLILERLGPCIRNRPQR